MESNANALPDRLSLLTPLGGELLDIINVLRALGCTEDVVTAAVLTRISEILHPVC